MKETWLGVSLAEQLKLPQWRQLTGLVIPNFGEQIIMSILWFASL
jgi:hypothetical protein